MVYCTKCGANNENQAEFCTSCGAALYISPGQPTRSRDWTDELRESCFGRDWGGECFGLRRGGALFGLIIGLLIIVAGVSALLGESVWRWIGPAFVIGIGFLILYNILKKWR